MIRTVSVWLGSVVLALSAAGQVESAHVDLFDPSDAGYEPLPPNRVILDVFVDVAPTDVWTASGLHVRVPYDLYQGGRVRLLYAPTDDPNTAQPDQLVNPGYENRFFTSISKPRPSRGGVGRFENARVSIAGGYAPTNPIAHAAEWDLNVAYFALPLETQDSPSVDGYIARIALDVDPWLYYPPWIFELATGTTVPTGALVIAEFKTHEALPGIGAATLDEPGVVGSDWFLYRTYVPEPATGVCAIAMLCALRRLRRVACFRGTPRKHAVGTAGGRGRFGGGFAAAAGGMLSRRVACFRGTPRKHVLPYVGRASSTAAPVPSKIAPVPWTTAPVP